jgi:uncharacterized membrane protein
MICLSLLIYLPEKVILMIGIILVAGHNALDSIVLQGQSLPSIIWYFLHQEKALVYGSNYMVLLHYPLIPWIGLMALGYLFGTFYQKDFDAAIRKKWLLRLGAGSIVLFFYFKWVKYVWRFSTMVCSGYYHKNNFIIF